MPEAISPSFQPAAPLPFALFSLTPFERSSYLQLNSERCLRYRHRTGLYEVCLASGIMIWPQLTDFVIRALISRELVSRYNNIGTSTVTTLQNYIVLLDSLTFNEVTILSVMDLLLTA